MLSISHCLFGSFIRANNVDPGAWALPRGLFCSTSDGSVPTNQFFPRFNRTARFFLAGHSSAPLNKFAITIKAERCLE